MFTFLATFPVYSVARQVVAALSADQPSDTSPVLSIETDTKEWEKRAREANKNHDIAALRQRRQEILTVINTLSGNLPQDFQDNLHEKLSKPLGEIFKLLIDYREAWWRERPTRFLLGYAHDGSALMAQKMEQKMIETLIILYTRYAQGLRNVAVQPDLKGKNQALQALLEELKIFRTTSSTSDFVGRYRLGQTISNATESLKAIFSTLTIEALDKDRLKTLDQNKQMKKTLEEKRAEWEDTLQAGSKERDQANQKLKKALEEQHTKFQKTLKEQRTQIEKDFETKLQQGEARGDRLERDLKELRNLLTLIMPTFPLNQSQQDQSTSGLTTQGPFSALSSAAASSYNASEAGYNASEAESSRAVTSELPLSPTLFSPTSSTILVNSSSFVPSSEDEVVPSTLRGGLNA